MNKVGANRTKCHLIDGRTGQKDVCEKKLVIARHMIDNKEENVWIELGRGSPAVTIPLRAASGESGTTDQWIYKETVHTPFMPR